MLNSFKKITAAVLSLGIIASGAGYSVADAATETVKWNAHMQRCMLLLKNTRVQLHL